MKQRGLKAAKKTREISSLRSILVRRNIRILNSQLQKDNRARGTMKRFRKTVNYQAFL